jgi:hypothetical protein
MSGAGATPLFVDTAAFLARFKPDDDDNHAAALELFDGIRTGAACIDRCTPVDTYSPNSRRSWSGK